MLSRKFNRWAGRRGWAWRGNAQSDCLIKIDLKTEMILHVVKSVGHVGNSLRGTSVWRIQNPVIRKRQELCRMLRGYTGNVSDICVEKIGPKALPRRTPLVTSFYSDMLYDMIYNYSLKSVMKVCREPLQYFASNTNLKKWHSSFWCFTWSNALRISIKATDVVCPLSGANVQSLAASVRSWETDRLGRNSNWWSCRESLKWNFSWLLARHFRISERIGVRDTGQKFLGEKT